MGPPKRNNFVPFVMKNDIAMIRVVNGDTLNVPSIAYATQKEKINGACEIGGYGSPGFSQPLSNRFQVAPIRITSMTNCIIHLGFITLPSMAGQSVLCVGGEETDTCQGDSGSGLICNGLLYGITSYG